MKKNHAYSLFNTLAYLTTGIVALLCLLPFLAVLSGSFTDNETIVTQGYHLWPGKFSLAAYTAIFSYPEDILNAYRVTLVNTVAGTLIGLFLIAMTGYVLAQKSFKYRNAIAFMIYFTSIFGGGLIPWYIVYTRLLHLKDSLLILCIPGLMSPFLIILMRTFMISNVPDALQESARVDGAGPFAIFIKIALPICKPALATIGLFLAIGYWNDWYLSSLFITSPDKYELQYFLYNMISGAKSLSELSAASGVSVSAASLPTESVKLAMAVLATGPVILFYPFAQKYFVQGITVGAVKG